ncbi:uncharacterized protein LOC113467177 [Diaphorina citri]|uniref:Uncharacterized protein LOC113467177 n=1 Tax=Diaphorina citri TaxID=121845 RepID=A0A3Q0IRV9_DIACI|nr:uncharacterized protein LOC113467177 [Diaphorina citri]
MNSDGFEPICNKLWLSVRAGTRQRATGCKSRFRVMNSDGFEPICNTSLRLIHETTREETLQINANLQCVAAQVKLPNFTQPISICNIYTPNTAQSVPYSEHDLTAIKNQLSSPFIILGDFNAHNPLWGSTSRSNEGKEVERFILNHSDLSLLNTGDATHFNLSYCSESAIDLTFCSVSIYPDIKWHVTDDLCFSDHFPILLTHDHPIPNVSANPSTPSIWNYAKADWLKFKSKIDFSFIDTYLNTNVQPNIDELLSAINTNIIDAAKESIPVKKIPANKLPVPWWDDEVKQAIKSRRKWLRKARRVPTIDNKIEFKKARALARKTIKEKRSSSWNQFVASIDHSTTSGEMFHKMNKLRGKYTPRHITALQDPSDPTQIFYDTPSIASSLAQQFSSVSSNENYSAQFLNYKLSYEATPIDFDFSFTQDYNSPLTYAEMSNALATCTSKAAGPDDISFLNLRSTFHFARASPSTQSIWNYAKADWIKFRSKIDFSFIDTYLDTSIQPNIDEILSAINANIIDAAKESIPLKKIPANKLPVPWWDDEVKQTGSWFVVNLSISPRVIAMD